jgi:hypothetical protein
MYSRNIYQLSGGGGGYVTTERNRGDGPRAGLPEFNSWKGQEIFFFLDKVETGSGAHSACHPMGTGGKATGACS